jgi:signal transduction histidine kinase
MLALQAIIYANWFTSQVQTQEQANLEFARSMALAFENYVEDVSRQEATIGELLEHGRPPDLQVAQEAMIGLTGSYPGLRSAVLLDSDGIVVATSEPSLLGQSLRRRQYFQVLMQGQQDTAVSDLLPEHGSDVPVFVIARRLRGTFNGVLAAAVEPRSLVRLSLQVQRQGLANYTFFDRTGTLLSSGYRQVVGNPNWSKQDDVLAAALAGREATGVITSPVDGSRRIAARVPIGSVGFVAGAARQRSEVMAPLWHGLEWLIGLNLAALAASGLLAWIVSRHITRRVAALQRQAAAIRHGDLDARSQIAGIRELADLSAALNQTVTELKARREEVLRSVEDLTRSNQELEQFAYVASHDLQEPLRVITGYVQLIERRYKGRLDPGADKFISFITTAVARLQQLINDLLAFSRIGTRGKPMGQVDMNAVVADAMRNLQQAIVESGATIRVQPLPLVAGDGSQLVQLLQNLLSNAIKFRSGAPPLVEIAAERQGPMWVFAVRDNGIGIEPQYQQQIFVIFQRLHGRDEYPGTGIGLAICRKIVEGHGGQIWVQSAPGAGATFHFTLPGIAEAGDTV